LLVRNVLGSWQLGLIYTAESGAPFSIAGGDGGDNSLSLQYGDRGDLIGHPFQLRHGGKSNWLNQYFNPAAFQPNAPGTFGTSPRNLFQAPPINTADLGIFKNWNIQLRWEMFNALNHPSFSGPNNDPSSLTFAKINSTGPIPPRVMQGALKFSF